MESIPWEHVLGSECCARLVRRKTPPRHEKWLAIAAIRNVERISAVFDKEDACYFVVYKQLLFGAADATGVAVLELEGKTAKHLPAYCVRRSIWRPPIDKDDGRYPYVVGPLEGTKALRCEILFPNDPPLTLRRLLKNICKYLRKGGELTSCSREPEPWTRVECHCAAPGSEWCVAYEATSAKSEELERMGVVLDRIVNEMSASGCRIPDGDGCQISYDEGAAEALRFAAPPE